MVNALLKFLLPVTACLLLTSCLFGGKEEESKPLRSYDVDDTVKSLFLYMPRSVWYYSDSATGQPVQLYVYGFNHGRYTYQGDHEYRDVEEYYVVGNLVHPPASGLDTALVQFELRERGMALGYRNFKVWNHYLQFGLYLRPTSKMTGSNDNRYFPSMAVRGRTYSDVYYSRLAGYGDECWLTEKEGIIRMHLRHPDEAGLDRVYELDSCRIIR